MAGLFRKVYDWLLRTFWLVYVLVSTKHRDSWNTTRRCPFGRIASCGRKAHLGPDYVDETGLQGNRDGRDHDWIAKCWQNFPASSSCGEFIFSMGVVNMATAVPCNLG